MFHFPCFSLILSVTSMVFNISTVFVCLMAIGIVLEANSHFGKSFEVDRIYT